MSGSSAIGSVLTISKDAIKAIDDIDAKLKSLQTAMSDTAKKANTEFTNMASSTKAFSDALDVLITKTGKVGSAVQSVATGVSSAWSGVSASGTSVAQSIEQMATAIKAASNNLGANKIAQQIGATAAAATESTRSIERMNDAAARKGGDEGIENIRKAIVNLLPQLQKARQDIDMYKQAIGTGKSGYIEWGQTGLKEAERQAEALMRQITALDVAYNKLRNSSSNVNEITGQTFGNQRQADKMAEMSAYYKELEKTSAKEAKDAERRAVAEERAREKEAAAAEKAAEREAKAFEKAAAAAEKAAEREAKAFEKAAAAAEKKAQKEAAVIEKMQASQQYQSYMSAPSLVISNNEGVKTLREHANAIKELRQARLNLDTTDKNYKQNLNAVNEAIKQHSKALREAGANTRNLQEQTSYLQQYLERWATRTAALFSINFAQNLVNQVVEVRGQFEMSQRSLEAILQDKSKADEIFNKTVELAVQSPFQIKDLVDYTRQLSAYRIESDKLYDTTKRLADVSAGLGVDMGRLILAYGQVKAAAYLRGSEVRQFTEAGINMYGELQAYFKEVKGEAYTTEQIVDMISKRMVSFADVEQVFQRMTDKGGTFYNMQSTQAETLQGKVANLKDSVDVMMNAIGKDNEGLLKGAVSAATGLLNCWEGIASTAKGVASLMALMVLYSKQMGAAKMSQMFTTNLSSLGTQVSLLGKLGAAAKSTAGAVVNFSKNLAGAVANNAVLIGLAALVKLVYEGYAMWDKWSDAVNKADEQMVESRGVIGALASSYRDLASAAGGLKGDQLAANIADRRAQLQKLVDAASKDGLKLTINVADIDENKLDATFNQVKKKYADFVDEINIVLKAHAANENWDTWFTDGVGDDMADYKDAVVDALATQKQLDAVISEINAHYGAATAATKKYFDEIRNGQKDGESNYDYMKRMVDVIQELNEKASGGKFTMASIFGGKAESDFKKVFSQIDDARRAAEKLDSEFDHIFESLKGEKDKVKIQAVIDRVAAEKEWNQYARDLAYKKFGITVNIDKTKAQQEVSWVDDYLTKFFAQKKYSVRLQVKQIMDDKAQEDFLSKGDTAGKAAKNWAEIEKRIKAVGKNTKTIKVDDSLRKLFNAGDQRISGKTIEVSTLKAMVAEYKKAATETANALGVDPFEKQANAAQKAQRDLLNERIQLLKDMASKYAELTKWETKEKALADTRSYFSDAAKNVGMDISSFVPDKRTVAAKIKEIVNQYKELNKRGSGLRVAADLVFDVRQEELKENLEKVKNQVQESLDGLSLFRKLNDAGLDKDTIKRMFGDNFATSFEDVRNQIESTYNEKWGTDKTKWSPETTKQYTEEVKKLNKQQYDEQISQFMELTKAYKNQLSEQLQLDRWYIEEREKIQSNENLAKNPILKQQYQSNLDKEYKTKTDQNTWKQFTGTNTYVEMFENLEYTSVSAINSMLEQLEGLKGALKNLEPEQVKKIVEQMEKLRDIKMNRYPLIGFAQSVKDIQTAQKEYVAATEQYVSAQKEKEAADNELAAAQANLNELENNRTLLSDEEYNNQIVALQEDVAEAMERQKIAIENLNVAQDNIASKNNRVTTAWMRFANQMQSLGSRFKTVTTNISTLMNTISGKASSETEKWINLLGETTSAVGDVIKAYKDLKSKAIRPIEQISDKTNGVINSAGNMSEKVTEEIEGTVTSASGAMVSTSVAASTAIKTIERASVILAIISAALQVAQAIANIFSDEGRIDDFMEAQQIKVEKLQHAYDKLKESVDNCFDINKLKEYSAQTEANLQAQILSLQSQIRAEKSRKSPDEGTIAGLEQDIEEAKDKIKELGETVQEELGGFGSDSNYKSAAEAFAEAWIDAFNDCESGIEALNDKWDEYFNNLITKQLMMRATTKYIKPLLAAVDKAVSKESSGGTALTKQEIEQLTQLKNEALQGYSQYAQDLMDALGIKPSGTVELSGLQQGIQGVTEATAQALESILNSMRYYLATQQADVRTIRDTLIARLGTATASVSDSTGNNQMITILEEQTGYLRTLSNNFSDVIKTGHSKGGKGLKVFLN